MIFNFFRRHKSPAASPAEQFPFFASKKELEGSKALPLLNEVEAELRVLQLQSKQQPLTVLEQKRHTVLEARRHELLGSGQVKTPLSTHLLVSEDAGQREVTEEWMHKTVSAHVLLVEDDHDLSVANGSTTAVGSHEAKRQRARLGVLLGYLPRYLLRRRRCVYKVLNHLTICGL